MAAVISRRQRIVLEFLTRVSEIKESNGFQTNAGLTPFLGEKVVLEADDPAAAVVVVLRPDIVVKVMENVTLILPIEVQALAKADINQPWLMVEALIADIKTAIELPDRLLGGLVRERLERSSITPMPRDPGSATVGASITYLVRMSEAWGAP